MSNYSDSIGEELWLFKTPIAIFVLTSIAIVHYRDIGLLPFGLLAVTAWMAWSLASGLYPWSMRL